MRPAVDFLLSWGLFALYLALAFRRAADASRRTFAFAAAAAACALSLPQAFRDPAAPRIRDGCAVRGGPDAPLVLYDSSWTPKTVLPHLEGAYRLPLAPGDHPLPAARILYFGDASEYAPRHPGAEADFFFPSEFFVP